MRPLRPPALRRRSATPFRPLLPLLALLALAAAPAVSGLSAQSTDADGLETALSTLELREIGPAVMGGRVADIVADENDPSTFYVGYASGGLWRTTSHGMSWTPIFDDQPTASIGAVALAPSNPRVVWVGTGEPQNRQSSPYGAGVFRSLDRGDTWEFMGLEETRHIGGIVVHPRDPNTVYVAAVGHLWGPNEERGVYRTTDGGETWEKVLYIDENTGAIDLVMDHGDPETLFAAMYQRRRTPWGFSADGPGSGIYRSLDGGDTWSELAEGLPEGDLGRIGLDIYRRDGDLVYATVEADEEGRGVYRSQDRGESWEKMSDRNPRPMYFSMIRIDPNNPERIYLGGVRFSISDDGGRTWWDGDAAEGVHLDHHAMWIDPGDSDHLLLGNDGGIATSRDGGENWRHYYNLAVGQFYQIGVDAREPYWVCGGLQDNNSWCGPNRTLTDGGRMNKAGPRNGDWQRIWGGDGFRTELHPSEPGVVYAESQNGRFGRYHRTTGEAASLQPTARPTAEDEDREYRWHWNTPLHVSHHDPATVYAGANHLMRTRDRGRSWEEASPDVTRQIDRDTLPIMGMPVDSTTRSRHDGVSHYGVISAIGESPLDPDLLYVGTDDGKFWVSRDGGGNWRDLTERVPDLRQGMWVSEIEPSHHDPGRVYLTFDGHKADDYRPHVLVSEDHGEGWRSLTEGLPADASVNVIREHPDTPELLFVGNEVGLYVSVDRGAAWSRITANFPTVPVDDIRIHPRENDLVVGTHGRSIWILDDVSPLEEIAAAGVLAEDVHLFGGATGTMWALRPGAWFAADEFIGDNPPDGVEIRYWLAREVGSAAGMVADDGEAAGDAGTEARSNGNGRAGDRGTAAGAVHDADAAVRVEILDDDGRVIRGLDGPGEAGIQRVVWDFRIDPPFEADEEEDGGFGGPPSGPPVLPGSYDVRLVAAGDTVRDRVEVRQDPRIDAPRTVLRERLDALMRLHELAGHVHPAEEALERARDRVADVRSVLERSGDGADELRQAADSLTDRIEEVEEALGEAAPGGRLTSQIEGVSEPPTADQRWRIERAEREVAEAIRDLNGLLTGDLADLEEAVYSDDARPRPLEAVDEPSPAPRR